ncbi:type 1 glutamine amidotransferase domain-containing protein [Agrilutibacter solisilvae]|uniref:Type 1 glutamine amidotransferase n=1 Tax=Agrilutibacter solisilvae TaxID=2763317 RepID=A0A974XXZ2_9GAMM|nr:type 1 glutamine amidotransferase domain-containing protein [Lysobacter solisilvae]QSX77861.1 type 1 glutamine amidotransferase [Lysobacter solisilvae]
MAGKRIAILATDGFEQSELMDPRAQLKQAGYAVDVISPKGGQIRGWKDKDWGDSVPVDVELGQASSDDYDALVLPGGQINPDRLRMVPEAVEFVRAFDRAGKPLAAICHGPWLLVESGAANGREVTSWPSVRTDLENAGARWKDAEVVTDGHIITSRKPADIPAFTQAVINAVG